MKVLNLILCSAFVFSTMAIAKDTQTLRYQKMCDDGNKAMCEKAKLYKRRDMLLQQLNRNN